LVAIAAEPVTAVVVPLVSEAHRDAVVAKGPELLDQPVVELAVPLPPEERLDRLASLQELRAIAPAAVGRVGEGDARGIARVPGVLGETDLLHGSLGAEGRKRGTAQGGAWRRSGAGGAGGGLARGSHLLVGLVEEDLLAPLLLLVAEPTLAPLAVELPALLHRGTRADRVHPALQVGEAAPDAFVDQVPQQGCPGPAHDVRDGVL